MKKTAFAILLVMLTAGCAGPQLTPESARVSLVYSERYDVDVPALSKAIPPLRHFLRIAGVELVKGRRIRDRLVANKQIAADRFVVPEPVTDAELLLVHTPAYVAETRETGHLDRFFQYVPFRGLPTSLVQSAVVEPFRQATGGTILACRLALRHGVAISLGGGFHHAMPGRGRGYCMFADTAVAIRVLQREARVERVLIVDLDLHQGNGNAVIFANDPTVFTFSVHGGSIYPIPKEQSTLDLLFDEGIDDTAYLALVQTHLPRLIADFKPSLIVYIAGADLHEDDPMDSFTAISTDGIVARDRAVVDTALRHGVPVAMVLAGGYGTNAWKHHFASISELLKQYGLAER